IIIAKVLSEVLRNVLQAAKVPALPIATDLRGEPLLFVESVTLWEETTLSVGEFRLFDAIRDCIHDFAYDCTGEKRREMGL
ncbi:hypothetical protein RVS43_002819, partial [Pseudomonas aeruginosa]|nr:hypothetical protein [Pseudomonas aeruginosa]